MKLISRFVYPVFQECSCTAWTSWEVWINHGSICRQSINIYCFHVWSTVQRAFCCLSTMASFCPFQIWMQHCTLNHVKSGSNWSNYKCFQGIFSGCYFYNLVQWANATALANACLWRFVSGQVLRLVLLLLWSDKNTNWVWILIMFAWFGVIIAYRSFHTS